MYIFIGVKFGIYWFVYDVKELLMIYYWNIINFGGGLFEFGSIYSGFKGEYIVK